MKLTSSNWQAAVLEVLEDLPVDLQQSCGYAIQENAVVITVAGETVHEDEGEADLEKVEVRYWDSALDEAKAIDPDGELGVLERYLPGGVCEHQASWPVVSVSDIFVSQGTYVGKGQGRSERPEVVGLAIDS